MVGTTASVVKRAVPPRWRVDAITLLLLPTFLLAGCNQKPLAVALIIDCTHSAQRAREERRPEFKRILNEYLPDDAQIAIIRLDHDPEIVAEGEFAYKKKELIRKFESAWVPRPCRTFPSGRHLYCGSDPVSALRLAVKFLERPEFERYRKLITGWIDLIPDPCLRNGRRNPLRFQDPATYNWEGIRRSPIEVILFGVPEKQQDRYLKAWRGRFLHSPRLFAPTHLMSPDRDLGLQRQGF